MKYTVSRKNWLRGEGEEGSALLTDNGKMCCLGFVALQCGLQSNDIVGVSCPGEVSPEKRSKFPQWLFKDHSQSGSALAAMAVNDDQDRLDVEREARLKAIFAEHGDEIEFLD